MATISTRRRGGNDLGAHVRFRDLAIGQRFTFANGLSFTRRCVKTSARKYETCDGGTVLRCRVGTIDVRVAE